MLAVIAVAGAVAAAGCASGDDHFRLAKTRSCLESRGYTTSIQNNWIFKPTNGSLVVTFGRQYVALNFGEDELEADTIRDGALRANEHWPIGATANVAYVWSVGAKTRVSGVLDCLRS
ncbi:MAG: hypothetical protein ACJ74P_10055 [Gaiellaceae bacterium]